jgi:hypothetical protein
VAAKSVLLASVLFAKKVKKLLRLVSKIVGKTRPFG